MANDLSQYDPDPLEEYEKVSLSDYIGRPVFALAGKEGEPEETQFGIQTPVIVPLLAIFGKDGKPALVRKDWKCWQAFRTQFLKDVIARLTRKPSGAYELVAIDDKKKVAHIELTAQENGWFNADKPVKSVKQTVPDDDDGF